jgi:hypothetical protein
MRKMCPAGRPAQRARTPALLAAMSNVEHKFTVFEIENNQPGKNRLTKGFHGLPLAASKKAPRQQKRRKTNS